MYLLEIPFQNDGLYQHRYSGGSLGRLRLGQGAWDAPSSPAVFAASSIIAFPL